MNELKRDELETLMETDPMAFHQRVQKLAGVHPVNADNFEDWTQRLLDEADRRENRVICVGGERLIIDQNNGVIRDECEVNRLLGSLVGLVVLLATGAFMATLFLNGGY